MKTRIETDVLIVGAGPAGATASLLLAQYGIKNLVISRFSSTSPTPRAHITNQRTMEIFRDLGIEEAAKNLSTPWSYMGENVYASSLVGEEYGRLQAWARSPIAQGEHMAASPCTYCDLPQLYFEPLLISEAGLRGANIRFQTEYRSHQQDEHGVTVQLFDLLTSTEFEVTAKYLIGADGARSQVAQDIGLQFEGEPFGDSGSINIEFEADLSQYCENRKGDMYWILQSGPGLNGLPNGPGFGVLRMIRPWNKWVCVVGYQLKDGTPKITEEQAKKYVYQIVGTDTIPVKIGNISTWYNNRQYALKNTQGRVFCMGDAIHRHTPFGGLGSNTSIQDAYNLAWKLAMVIKGQAQTALLESYEQERIPVAKLIVNHAFESTLKAIDLLQATGLRPGNNHAETENALQQLKEANAEGAERRANLHKAVHAMLWGFGGAHGIEMNQRYISNAIVSDGTVDPGFTRDQVFYHQASTRPGAHVPHVWLEHKLKQVSLLDLCGKGKFTLLTCISGQKWLERAKQVAQELNIDLDVHIIGLGEYSDSYGDYYRLSDIEESGALLVRPDLMIAWRAHDSSQDSLDQLSSVLKKILGYSN